MALHFRHLRHASAWHKATFLLRVVPWRERLTLVSTAQLIYIVLGAAFLPKTAGTWTALFVNLLVLCVVQWSVSARHLDRLVAVRRFHPRARTAWLKAWSQ